MTLLQAGLLSFWILFITYMVVHLYLYCRPMRRKTKGPLPIDPANPPKKTFFLQADGEEPVRCDCHDKPISDWSEVWYWPQPPKFICIDKGDVA